MTLLTATWIALASIAAGALNTIVGGGSLLTYSVLGLCGLPALAANVTNSVGLLPGSAYGAWVLRRQLRVRPWTLGLLIVIALGGGAEGAWLLMWLPSTTAVRAVPYLIGVACVLVLAGPYLRPYHARHQAVRTVRAVREFPRWIGAGALAAGLYGGFFAAGQGVVFIAVLQVAWPDLDIRAINALKNVLATAVVLSATVVFSVLARPAWLIAAVMTPTSIAGGAAGAWAAGRMPKSALRLIVVAAGGYTIVHFLT